MAKANIESFFDPVTCTFSYVIYDHVGGNAAVLDPVLDYDPKSGRTSNESIARIEEFLLTHQLKLMWLLETHAHADHMSGARTLQQRLGGTIGIGAEIGKVQTVFKEVFHLDQEFCTDGTQFGKLFSDGEIFRIGDIEVRVLAVPGHTPADVAYVIEDAIFVGDTMFMPDVGTARCDFPGGNASQLYASIKTLLSFPDTTRLFMCHDYPPSTREPQCATTVADQREKNIHVHDGVEMDSFVQMRTARDAGLSMPVLLLPSIQVNIQAGELPKPEANGVSYLKIPLNAL